MKCPSRLLLASFGCWAGLALLVMAAWPGHSQPAAASDAEVAAHRSALEVAGAFSNDGFKLRDGTFAGTIKPKQNVVVQVNLYAGNEYWFSVGATEQAKKLVVTVYDETGRAVQSEPYQQESQAAAGFSPETSGPYFVCIQEVEGNPASFCFLYSYK
jgi:hypothetical protein